LEETEATGVQGGDDEHDIDIWSRIGLVIALDIDWDVTDWVESVGDFFNFDDAVIVTAPACLLDSLNNVAPGKEDDEKDDNAEGSEDVDED
jgi:hypothetical protein